MKKILSLLIFLISFWVFEAISQVNLEIPSDRILTDAKEIKSLSENLSSDLKKQIQSQVIKPDFRSKLVNAAVGDYVQLTREEKRVLENIGMSDDEIKSIDFINKPEASKNSIGKQVNSFVGKKQEEAKDILMQDAIPGLGASVLGLTFSTFLAPLVLMKCWSQTSAKVFGITGVAWVGLELMSWNNYKFEYEEISKLGDTQKVSKEVQEIAQKIIRIYNEIQDKMNAMNIVSIDQASSVIDGNLQFLQDKVSELRVLVKQFQKQFVQFSDDQINIMTKLRDSFVLIRDHTKNKVKNASIAGVGFATASALAFAEKFNLIGAAGGRCVANEGISSNRNGDFLNLSDIFFPPAIAGAKEFAMSNFDKLGIPIGGGILAAYLIFKAKFMNPIISSSLSRGITFGIMAGIAGVAAWKMKEFVKYLDEQIKLIDDILAAFRRRVGKTEDLIDRGDDFLQFVEQIIIPQARTVVNQVGKLVDGINTQFKNYKSEIQPILDDKVKELKDKYGDNLEKIDELKDKYGDDLEKIDEFKDEYGDNVEKIDKLEDEYGDDLGKIKEQFQKNKGDEIEVLDDAKEKLEEVLKNNSSSLYNHLVNMVIRTAEAGDSESKRCLYGIQKIQLDNQCKCRKIKKCTNIKLNTIVGKKGNIIQKLSANSNLLATGLKYLSNGFYKRSNLIFEKFIDKKNEISLINNYFFKKLKNKKINEDFVIKQANQEILKLSSASDQLSLKSYTPPKNLLKRSGYKISSPSKQSNQAMNRLKNILLVKDYFSRRENNIAIDKDGTPKKIVLENSDFEVFRDVEMDKTKNLFKIISRRYLLIYQNKN